MRLNTHVEMTVLALMTSALLLSACGGGGGGGGGGAPAAGAVVPTPHSVTLTWTANRETGVNSAGGGYLVGINGPSAPAPITVLYNAASGITPNTTTTTLWTGTYTATVSAFAALDAKGGTTGSLSASSVPITIVVP